MHETTAFVGTPNSGKSTLFNVLTGMRQKVGNFPGVTLEPALGEIGKKPNSNTVLDLPGIYSLDPISPDEELASSVLYGTNPHIPKPSRILFIMDATSIEKGLFLYSQISNLGIPIIIAVTMVDSIKAQGGVFDDISLERILGIPIIPVVGHKGIGLEEVQRMLADSKYFIIPDPLFAPADITERILWARATTKEVLSLPQLNTFSTTLDKVLLHPIGGIAIFLSVMILFFQSIFSWASPLMDVIETLFGNMQEQVAYLLPQGIIADFISRGLIAGVGSVIVFLPQILLLNIIIVILEDCGYLARAAFLVDRFMGIFGLQGRSFIPLLGSFACAIPGIMSARIIPSHRERMATMLIAPLMTCSARLPVYTLLISAFIPTTMIWGFFSLQAAVLAGLYVIAALVGLFIALLMKKTIFKGDITPFLIEFPPYRMPSLKSLLVTVYDRSKDFLTSAGTVIVTLSIILWFLSAFPRTDFPPETSSIVKQQMQLEQSYAGSLGKVIEPIFTPLGFDWKLTIGIIGSFAAREVFVTVMGQLYATDTSLGDESLRQILYNSIPLASALSVLAFYVFALQCISTMAILKRETGSWKWPAFAFVYTFVLAYIFAFATYRITLALIS